MPRVPGIVQTRRVIWNDGLVHLVEVRHIAMGKFLTHVWCEPVDGDWEFPTFTHKTMSCLRCAAAARPELK